MAGSAARAPDRAAPYRTDPDRADPHRWSDRWWTLVSRVYDPAVGLVGWHRGLRELLDGLSSRTVLDVGCGPAYLSRLLTARGVAYVGMDRNAAMLSHARRRIVSGPGRGAVVRAELGALPFADRSFDVVVATGVLGLLELTHRGTALREMARVSKGEVRLLEPIHRPGAPVRLARARFIGLVRDRPIDLAELAAAGLQPVSLDAPLLAGVYTPVRAVRV